VAVSLSKSEVSMVYKDFIGYRDNPNKRPADLDVPFIADKKNHSSPLLVVFKREVERWLFFNGL
jgi:hypothetical protein